MPTNVPKDWGSERVLVNNELYCLKEMRLLPYKRCSLHKHLEKDETFVVLEGTMILELGVVSTIVTSRSEPVRIRPGVLHRFANWAPEDCVFLEVSTHHEDSDVERIEPSGNVDVKCPIG